jgi:hypothetical protein
LLTTVSITIRALARHFSMIRGGRGAEMTPNQPFVSTTSSFWLPGVYGESSNGSANVNPFV